MRDQDTGVIVPWLTERERKTAWLRDNPPENAGGEYENQEGLLRHLATLKKDEIADFGRWIKMHYVNTDGLLMQIKKIHANVKK